MIDNIGVNYLLSFPCVSLVDVLFEMLMKIIFFSNKFDVKISLDFSWYERCKYTMKLLYDTCTLISNNISFQLTCA